MNDIEIAAPVAVMGYASINANVPKVLNFPKEDGIYRVTMQEYDDSGIKKERLYISPFICPRIKNSCSREEKILH